MAEMMLILALCSVGVSRSSAFKDWVDLSKSVKSRTLTVKRRREMPSREQNWESMRLMHALK